MCSFVRRVGCLLPLLFTTVPAPAQDAEFFVRPVPYGNDANGGMDIDDAVASLEVARQRIEAWRENNGGLEGPIFVNVGGGVYELTSTFVLGAGDGGSSGCLVTYRAADLGDPLGDRAIISGGTAVSGWTLSGSIYSASWSPPGTPEQRPRDLYRAGANYDEGVRLTRARYPNVDSAFPYASTQWLKVASTAQVSGTDYWSLTADSTDSCYTSPSIPQDGSSTDSGVEIVARRKWISPRQNVLVSSPHQWTGTTVKLFRRLGHSSASNILIGAGEEFFLEGAAEWIDLNDEWSCTITGSGDFLHTKAASDPDNSTMIAPRLTTLVRLDRAQYVAFENLIFCYTNRPKLQYGYNSGGNGHAAEAESAVGIEANDQLLQGAVEFLGSQNCSMTGCTVAHTGGNGVIVQSHVDGSGNWTFATSNTISGCDLYDLGGNGVYAGSLKTPWVTNHWVNMWTSPPKYWIYGTQVLETEIRGFGMAFHDAAGVLIRKTDGTTVSHCEITSLTGTTDAHSSRYTGIVALSFNQSDMDHSRETALEYNHIHHVASRLSDGGGIYIAGSHPDSRIEGNWIHAMPRDPRLVKDCLANVGLYFDLGSNGFTVQDNLIEAVGNYTFNPGTPYCPTAAACTYPERIGTMQFHTKGDCCSPTSTYHFTQCPSGPMPCHATTKALPSNQTWPGQFGLTNYVDADFAHLVPGYTMPTYSYSVFSPGSPPGAVLTIRTNAGP